jgi:hypothetical protein
MQVPVNTGYDNYALAGHGNPPSANGFMTHSGNTVSMYVFDVSIDFGLSGSTAQSSGTRSFFPRNLTQPSIHIAVQCPTQRHMAELAEFVRMTQKNMWEPVTLEIKQRNKTLYRNVGRRLKGTHSPIKATGYVKSIPREHNANEASPEVTFDFSWSNCSVRGWTS